MERTIVHVCPRLLQSSGHLEGDTMQAVQNKEPRIALFSKKSQEADSRGTRSDSIYLWLVLGLDAPCARVHGP